MATLYRKYRSQRFDEIIGQDPIVTTLTNQIKLGRIGHAYLFTGSRGTGKTSCARIFARAVNCLHPVNGSPCGECEVCKKLAVDNVDIIEMDAASNNGVDDARDIREKVKYLPVACKYKVYIIDEVHMLTGGAFNALLKTIEEPPDHVIFILATTEPQKLPQTILSRCIRFDFRLIPTDILAKHLASVYDKEGIKYTYPAVEEIARLGEGSVRDALSVADTIAAAAEEITPEIVLALTGAGDSEAVSKLFDCTASRDLPGMLNAVDGFVKSGKSMPTVARQLIDYTRNVLVAKSVGKAAAQSGLINTDKASLDRIVAAADKYSVADISRMLEELGAAENGLKYSVNPRVFLETALVKLVCGAQREDDILRRITALEKNSAVGDGAGQKKNNKQITYSAVAEQSPPLPDGISDGTLAVSNNTEASNSAETVPAKDSAANKKAPRVAVGDTASTSPPSEKADKHSAPAPTEKNEPEPLPEYEPEPPPESYNAARKASQTAPPARQNAVPQNTRQTAQARNGNFEIKQADEGEFFHRRAVADDSLQLLGCVSFTLRKSQNKDAVRVLRLLANGVEVKERADAIAFVSPEEVFLSMSAAEVIKILNGVLDSLGIKKRARIERTADDMYHADLDKAKRLFGIDCVFESDLPRYVD